MEEHDMHHSCSQSSKAHTTSHGKEGAHVKRAFLLISFHIKIEVGVNDAGNVVDTSLGSEELRGEDGEGLGIVQIVPVGEGGEHIHDEHKAGCNIGGGEPRAGQRAAEVRGDRRPVEADDGNAEAGEAGAELLGEDGMGEDPTYPWEGGEHGEEVARDYIVGKAAYEGNEEELVPA